MSDKLKDWKDCICIKNVDSVGYSISREALREDCPVHGEDAKCRCPNYHRDGRTSFYCPIHGRDKVIAQTKEACKVAVVKHMGGWKPFDVFVVDVNKVIDETEVEDE